MTKRKTTKQKPAKQGSVANLIPDRFTYNVKQVEDFLDMVFHADPPPDGNVLTWFAKKQPGYPISEDELEKLLTRSGTGAALYFGTSTTARDETDGRLYNRKALFRSYHVLVLDDIGQKVPFDKIPETFDPTYKIETSEGSYHYGYVLEEPILVEEHAAALVQLVYDAGFSDKGGKMATKLVRLPDGINNKPGDGQHFRVRLDDMDGPLWTPESILEEIDCGVAWKDVIADVDAVMKMRAATSIGTSAWAPIKPHMPTLDGVIDPALEWLYEQGMVKQEAGDWVTILCPWCADHTAGGDMTAGYSPMGWGAAQYQNHRIFHCFHEHCKQWKNEDFLQYILTNGGPDLPVTERAAHLVRRYALYSGNDGVYDIMAKTPRFIKMAVFKNLHPEIAYVVAKDKAGKPITRAVPETRMFVTSKARLTVDAEIYDPTTPARVIQTDDGNLVNTYVPPPWGDGDYDQDDVDKFEAYMKYLIPRAEARKFFLDWLAAKCQDMAFRGPAILMIATRQGTGRTTLGNMLTHMLGMSNVVKKPFADIIKVQQFNAWMAKGMVITDETLAVDDETQFHRAAERLKERIDTTPTFISVERKRENEFTQMCYSSYLLFSNHADAMRLGEDDRRFYVLDNPEKPAPAEFFTALNQWIEDGTWAKAVFRWLREREVDISELLKPPEMTKAKANMIESSKQPVDIAIDAILDAWPSALITQNNVTQIIEKFNLTLRLNLDPSKMKYALRRVFRAKVVKLNIADGEVDRFAAAGIAGLTHWVPRCKLTPDILATFVENPAGRIDIDEEREKMLETYEDMGAAIFAALDAHDL